MPPGSEEHRLKLGPRWWLKRTSLLAVIATLGFGAVYGTLKYLESREPLVNLSERENNAAAPGSGPGNGKHLRFAVATMVTPESTFRDYERLVERIGRDVGREGVFLIPPSYSDARNKLEDGAVDVALVCTGTYVHALPGGLVKLLAQPEFPRGREYRSLFLVPAGSPYEKLEDLRGKTMAFTDPESNTGYIVPTAEVAGLGRDPGSFFRKIVFTGSHDRSITAVATGIVDCAAVDSLVWEASVNEDPSLADRARLIWRSEPFGPPPIVVPAGLDEKLRDSLQKAFLALDEDREGREILAAIGIERFVRPKPDDYRTAIEIHKNSELQERTP